MDLTRTRRTLQKRRDMHDAFSNALTLLDTIDEILEDAQETLEDQMRIHQQSIGESDVTGFVESSVERLTRTLMKIGNMEQLLTLIIEHDKDAFENTLSSLRTKIDEARADREHWKLIGNDLGDLDDHPF